MAIFRCFKRMRKIFLALVVILVVLLSLRPATEASAATPASPVRPWIKLGVVAYGAQSTADAAWAAQTFDWLDGPPTGSLPTIKQTRNVASVTYDEYRSVWFAPTTVKIDSLTTYASSHGINIETMLMHFSDSTTYKKCSSISCPATTVPGGFTAPNRVPAYYPASPPSDGWVINPKDANARAWMVSYITGIVMRNWGTASAPAYYDGTFVDNVVPQALLKSMSNTVDSVTSGGHYYEYPGDRTAAANAWDIDMKGLMAQVKTALLAAGKTQQVTNEAELSFPLMDSTASTGAFREKALYQFAYGTSVDDKFNTMKNLLKADNAAGLNTYITASIPQFATDPTWPNPAGTTDDRKLLMLSLYYLLSTPSSYFGLQSSEQAATFRTDTYTPLVEFDVGPALEEGHVYATGTDTTMTCAPTNMTPCTYYLYGRAFRNALVLVKLVSSPNKSRGTATATSYNLGGSYYRLNPNNTSLAPTKDAAAITSVSLQNWQGAILFKDSQTSPTLYFTKSVDKTSAKSGDVITYTLTYSNTGTGVASSAKIEDTIPIGTTFVSASNSGTSDGTKVTWNLGGIAAGTSNTSVTFQVRIN